MGVFGKNLPAAEAAARAHAKAAIGVCTPAAESEAAPATAAAAPAACRCLVGCRSSSEQQYRCRNSDDAKYYSCFCMHCNIILH